MQGNTSHITTRLEQVRALIFLIAGETKGIGEIEESIKWGQASFATLHPKSGTPIRIAGDEQANTYSVYVPCLTSLISDFRETHPEMFEYHGKREIRFDAHAEFPKQELSLFVAAALTYYQK